MMDNRRPDFMQQLADLCREHSVRLHFDAEGVGMIVLPENVEDPIENETYSYLDHNFPSQECATELCRL